MQLDRLTQKAQEALLHARDLAAGAGQPEVSPEHLLAALLDQEEGVVRPVLAKMGVAAAPLRQAVQHALDRLPRAQGGAEPGMSAPLQAVLRDALAIAPELRPQIEADPALSDLLE